MTEAFVAPIVRENRSTTMRWCSDYVGLIPEEVCFGLGGARLDR